MSDNRSIGIFDSGLGGLTVYKALKEALPRENFVYLGDTARLPYGTKSLETVTQYALQAARLLLEKDIKLLVVACNTASALALPNLRKLLPELPCMGVIEPGAEAASKASINGNIVVLATEGTVRSGAYADAVRRNNPNSQVHGVACNLLVGMVEEGWCDGAEAEAVVRRYLRKVEGMAFDTLVLGCTHFPMLTDVFRKLLPDNVAIVDSAATTAVAIDNYLLLNNLETSADRKAEDIFLVTDAPDRFQLLAQRFLTENTAYNVKQVFLKPAKS